MRKIRIELRNFFRSMKMASSTLIWSFVFFTLLGYGVHSPESHLMILSKSFGMTILFYIVAYVFNRLRIKV